jgi:hypothetical protein
MGLEFILGLLVSLPSADTWPVLVTCTPICRSRCVLDGWARIFIVICTQASTIFDTFPLVAERFRANNLVIWCMASAP